MANKWTKAAPNPEIHDPRARVCFVLTGDASLPIANAADASLR
jgi:hypothetical protein